MGVRDEEQPSRERYLRLAEDPYWVIRRGRLLMEAVVSSCPQPDYPEFEIKF
jgi:hypothetical protein